MAATASPTLGGNVSGQPPAPIDPFLWNSAAAWADTTVEALQADTATVRAAHYQAALRVDGTFNAWLERHDYEAAQRATAERAAGNQLVAEIAGLDRDPFARLMLLAEDYAELTAAARDRGDAALAAKYSSFETSLLQVAADIQADENMKVQG